MSDNKIIDFEEKVLTKDEIETDYVDIKQASQILNNVSTRTAYRYIDTVLETKGVNVKVIEIVSNGGKKKLYLKADIINISKILNKDKTVLVNVPFSVNDRDVNDSHHSESVPSGMSSSGNESRGAVKEGGLVPQDNANQLVKKIEEGFSSINELKLGVREYADNIRELNDNIRNANITVQSFMGKVIDQGIDLKERYLKDREERTQIERQQAETLRLLLERTSKPTSPNGLILLVSFLVLVIAGGTGWFFITTSQQRIEKQFDERLTQERQLQKDQYQETIKQLQESLSKLTIVNSVGNPSIEPVKK